LGTARVLNGSALPHLEISQTLAHRRDCMSFKKFVPTLAVGALFTFASMSFWASAQEPKHAMAGATTKAIAVLHPTKGSNAHGTVTFTKVADGVKIHAHISGLTPGKHGFHVHEFGDCSSPDAKSAGGHFNPEKLDHGDPHSAKRHVGDL